MKRSLLWLVVSVVAALSGGTAAGGTALAIEPLAEHDLVAVTGAGCVSKCDDDEPDEPYSVGFEWRTIKQVDAPAEQLSYSILAEVSNVYGVKPKEWEYTVSDNCRYRWTSGGVGITNGFNISIGTVYHCASSMKLRGVLDPGWRLKIYRGEMRQITTVTMGRFEIFSDGSSEDTGTRDTGRKERFWSRYTPVPVYGN